MAERNDRFRAWREATESPSVPGVCLSRSELADAVNSWLAAKSNRRGAVNEEYVARLEQGRIRWPNREYRAAFRAVLGVASDEQLGLRPSNRQPVSPLAAVEQSDGLLSPDDIGRLTSAASCPRRTDASALDSLTEVLLATRRLEDETSAAHVLQMVTAQQVIVDRLAAGAKRSMRARAVSLSSEISQYLGWLHIPLGRWDEARRWLDRAAVSAMEADDPDRLSTALSFSAYLALKQNDYHSAGALNEAARRDTRVHIGQRTYEAYQQAEVFARNGERTDAVRLLSEADTMTAHLPPADELPTWGYWYVPAFFIGERGLVLRSLGDTHGAREAARESLAALPAEWRGSEWAEERRRFAEE